MRVQETNVGVSGAGQAGLDRSLLVPYPAVEVVATTMAMMLCDWYNYGYGPEGTAVI